MTNHHCLPNYSFVCSFTLSIGRVFYYRLPISEGHNVTITETSSGSPEGLPRWLELVHPSMELVGIPSHEDKRMHFMHVKVVAPNGNRMDDVFVLDVIDGPSQPTPQSDCILRLTPQMESVSQVWRLIKNLVPNHRDWLHLFNVNSYWEELGYRYQVTLDQDQCSDTRHGFEGKLRSLGLHFHKIRIIKSDWTPQELDYRRNHRRRHAAIQPTPSVNGWPYAASSIVSSASQLEEDLTRVIPSLSSPSLMASASLFPSMSSGMPSPVTSSSYRAWTNLYTTPVILPSLVTSALLPPDMDNEIFASPSTIISPTPTLPLFTPTATATEQLTTSEVIFISPSSPSSSVPVDEATITSSSGTGEPSTVPSVATSSSTEGSEFPEEPVPPVSVNSAPSIRKRIQKLLVIAGSWWKYVIPDDAFEDREDGGTRSLKLSFYLKPDGTGRDSPAANYWIQLDSENQFLYALPTEKDIGRHTFVLIAADTGGQFVEEEIEVIVRQHRAYRAFHHWIGLHSVAWDTVKYPVMIQAAEKLLSRIAKQAFSDSSLDAIYVQTIRSDRGDTFYISWTNVTLPLQPCPRALIDSHFTALADTNRPVHNHNNQLFAPSATLKQILIASEFKIRSLQLTLDNVCKDKEVTKHNSIDGEITVRNPISLLQITIGQVFRYKIPNDMFYTASGTDTIGLEIELLTISSTLLPNDSPIGFKKETQEIYALALPPLPTEPQELILLVKDPVSGAQTASAFGVEYVPAQDTNTPGPSQSFHITMALIPQSEESPLILETKVNVIYRIATQLLSDVDPSHVYVQSFQPLSFTKQRQKRGVPISSSPYYELIWTNSSLSYREVCPVDHIKSSVVDRIFFNDLDHISRIFEPDFELMAIQFTPLGNCSKMRSERLGTPPTAVFTVSPLPTTTTSTISPVSVGPSEEDTERAYYMSSILPALVTLVVMLFVALCVVCVLVRYRRSQEKRGHLEVVARRSGERDAFLSKGRTPVILEQELQQHPQHNTPYGFYSPVVMPPPPPHHQNPQVSTHSAKGTFGNCTPIGRIYFS